MKEIGTIIKEHRKKNGLTQAQLAEQIKVSQPAIGKYEKNERTPSLDTINKLVDVLGFDFYSDITYFYIKNAKSELKKAQDEINDPDFIMKSLFRTLASEMNYTVGINGEDCMIIDDAFNSYSVETEKIRSLYNRFIQHMKIDFQAFLEEQENNGKEK